MRWRCVPAPLLPTSDGSLDGIITVNTIYFVPELGGAFAEFARVLKNAGRVIVGLGDPEAMAREPLTSYGFRVRPVAEVIDELGRAGSTVDEDVRVGKGSDGVHLLVAARSNL